MCFCTPKASFWQNQNAISSLVFHGLRRTSPTHHRSRYIPLHLHLKLGYRIESSVTLPTTATECITDRQTYRWETVICSTCALRRPSAAFATFPTAKLPSIAFYYGLGEVSPKSTLTPILTHFALLSCQPIVDLPLDLERCHKTFRDASYYRDRMHCEQTAILRDIYRYPIPPTPTPQPSPTLPLCPSHSHVDLPLDLGKYCGKFGDASYHRDWMYSEQTDRQTDKFSSLYI